MKTLIPASGSASKQSVSTCGLHSSECSTAFMLLSICLCGSRRCILVVQEFLSVWTHVAFRIHMTVERLAGNAQLSTQVAHLGVAVGHRRLSEAELCGRHGVGPAAVAASGAG